MRHAAGLAGEIGAGLRRNGRPLLTFHLFFTGLTLAVLAPATAWLLTALLSSTGQPVVSDAELLRFAVSPAGLGWLLAGGTLVVLVVIIEHAGMIFLAAYPGGGRYHAASAALWQVGRRLTRLMGLATVMVAAQMALAAPFLLAIAGLYLLMLGELDPYYLVSEQPPILWQFAAASLPLLAGLLIVNGGLYVRWLLALPALLLEDRSLRAALQRSAALTRGSRLRMAVYVLAMAALVAGLPFLLTLAFEGLGRLLLGPLPERFTILVPAILVFLGLHIALAFVATGFAVAANSLLFYELYRRTSGRAPAVEASAPPRGSAMFAWSTEIAVLLLALAQASWALASFDFRDDVTVIAHRGSSMQAPENTLAAIEQAIEDGADYVEIDVRASADGIPVLLHDRDLRRVAGLPRDVWELDFDTLRGLDVGSWFDPAHAGERIPSLAEAIRAVRGRAGLYIEIKPGLHSPALTASVLELLEAEQMLAQTILAAMDRGLLHSVAALQPQLRRSLIVHTVIGEIDRGGLHALGLRAATTTPAEVVAAQEHGHELHVWTVNHPAQMSRFIDLGADGIITDRPAALVNLLEERAALSDAELLLIKMRSWLWQ